MKKSEKSDVPEGIIVLPRAFENLGALLRAEHEISQRREFHCLDDLVLAAFTRALSHDVSFAFCSMASIAILRCPLKQTGSQYSSLVCGSLTHDPVIGVVHRAQYHSVLA